MKSMTIERMVTFNLKQWDGVILPYLSGLGGPPPGLIRALLALTSSSAAAAGGLAA